MKHQKSNMTVEVSSEKLEVYRIAQQDVLHFFDLYSNKTIESLKGLDNTQQINMLIKLKHIEGIVLKEDTDSLQNISLYESNSIRNAPEFIRENHGLTVLKDALKNQELSGNAKKLEDLKFKLQAVKKEPSKSQQDDALSKLKAMSSATPASDNKDLSKNIALGTQRLAPKSMNKLGLTENQLASKNKLSAFAAVKKVQQSEEEVSSAFQRINQKKKTQGISINKLVAGLEPKNQSLSFEELAKKFSKEKQEQTEQPAESSNPNPEDSHKEEEDEVKILIKKKESKDNVNIEKISKLDNDQLLKNVDNLKNKSSKSIELVDPENNKNEE